MPVKWPRLVRRSGDMALSWVCPLFPKITLQGAPTHMDLKSHKSLPAPSWYMCGPRACLVPAPDSNLAGSYQTATKTLKRVTQGSFWGITKVVGITSPLYQPFPRHVRPRIQVGRGGDRVLGRSPVAVTLGGGMGLLGLAQGRTLEMALRHEMGPRPTDAP